MLKDDLKRRITEAMKAKREIERDILRVALGEIGNVENRSSAPISEEEQQKIVKKLIKSNQETLAVADRPEMRARLEEENRILEGLLPKSLGVSEIIQALAPVAEQIKGAKGEGPATGVAMKLLKSTGASVEGKDVAEAVKQIRGT